MQSAQKIFLEVVFMTQSALHVAVIMDGNGRWARARGRERHFGHRVGARVVRRIVSAAPALGIGELTLYAFSADNWQRPAAEVSGLMRLFEVYLRNTVQRCQRDGVRVRVIGRRDRLAAPLLRAMENVELATTGGTRLRLNLAMDHSSRHAIETGQRLPDVDLLVRTGGEQRLSDFLLWESAYAELYFTTTPWPEFTPSQLAEAVAELRRRDRRFGGVSAQAADTVARVAGAA
jgi:undecaprenyl diphosphate synthase